MLSNQCSELEILFQNFKFIDESVDEFLINDFSKKVKISFRNVIFKNISIWKAPYLMFLYNLNLILEYAIVEKINPAFIYAVYSTINLKNVTFSNFSCENKFFHSYTIFIEYSNEIIVKNCSFFNLNTTLDSPVLFPLYSAILIIRPFL